jgi:hypothetical protein
MEMSKKESERGEILNEDADFSLPNEMEKPINGHVFLKHICNYNCQSALKIDPSSFSRLTAFTAAIDNNSGQLLHRQPYTSKWSFPRKPESEA